MFEYIVVPALALASGCEEGWIEVEGGCDGSDAVCIKMERPIKVQSRQVQTI